MIQMVADEIRRLSQDEGLNDSVIAQALGISRATVNRARQTHDIPRASLENRKDKHYECGRCGAIVAIARKERRVKYCPLCKPVVEAENLARKMDRYRIKTQKIHV